MDDIKLTSQQFYFDMTIILGVTVGGGEENAIAPPEKKLNG